MEPYEFRTGGGRHPKLIKIEVSESVRVRGTRRSSGKVKRGIVGADNGKTEDGDLRPKILRPTINTMLLEEHAMYYITSATTTHKYASGQRDVFRDYHIIVRDSEGNLFTAKYHDFVNNETMAMDLLDQVNSGILTGYEALSMVFI